MVAFWKNAEFHWKFGKKVFSNIGPVVAILNQNVNHYLLNNAWKNKIRLFFPSSWNKFKLSIF